MIWLKITKYQIYRVGFNTDKTLDNFECFYLASEVVNQGNYLKNIGFKCVIKLLYDHKAVQLFRVLSQYDKVAGLFSCLVIQESTNAYVSGTTNQCFSPSLSISYIF